MGMQKVIYKPTLFKGKGWTRKGGRRVSWASAEKGATEKASLDSKKQ